jgi:hypothetical protein
VAFLPEPSFGDDSNVCLRCAYPLEGMPDAGRCPECGLPFHDAADTLVLHGVSRTQEALGWRRAVWIMLAILIFIFTQAIVPLVLYKPLYAGIAAAALVVALLGMVLTGAPRRRGTDRFIITPSGLSRGNPGAPDRPDFILWDGPVFHELRKVSPVWRRLILTGTRDNRPVTYLDAGVRCRESDLPRVKHLLIALAARPLAAPTDNPDAPMHADPAPPDDVP